MISVWISPPCDSYSSQSSQGQKGGHERSKANPIGTSAKATEAVQVSTRMGRGWKRGLCHNDCSRPLLPAHAHNAYSADGL